MLPLWLVFSSLTPTLVSSFSISQKLAKARTSDIQLAQLRSTISWPSFIHLVHRLDVSFSSKDPQTVLKRKVVKWCKAKSHEYLWRDWLLGDHLVEATFRTCVPGIRNLMSHWGSIHNGGFHKFATSWIYLLSCVPGIRNLMSHWRVYNIHNIHNIESI